MRNNILIFLILLCSASMTTTLAQSTLCTDTTQIFLNNEGMAVFDAENVPLDTALYDSLSLQMQEFSCADMGFRQVEVSLFKDGEPANNCTAIFEVIDREAPILVMDVMIREYIEPNDTLELKVSDLPLDIYDNCTIDSILISPNRFDTSHRMEDPVSITAIDQSGNQTTNLIQLMISTIDCDSFELRCKKTYHPNLTFGSVQINPRDLVNKYIKNCDFPFIISWTDIEGNPLQIDNDILTMDHLGLKFIAIVENTETQESCSVEVQPEICLPLMESSIGWPEDLRLSFSCSQDSIPDLHEMSPKIMRDEMNLDSKYFSIDMDTICNEHPYLAYAYEDEIISSDSLETLLRTWTLLDWRSQEKFSHVQTIRVKPGSDQFDQLSCMGETDFYHGSEPYRVIEAEDVILENGVLICDSIVLSFLDSTQQPLQLPGNRIYKSLEHTFIYVVSTAIQSGQQCTTKVHLDFGPFACWEKFHICDQLPHGQNFDHCDSNYTTEDYIEWPRNLSIAICDSAISGVTPEYLQSLAGIEMEDAYPTVVMESCQYIHIDLTYQDQLLDSAGNQFPKHIDRTWTISVGRDSVPDPDYSWSYTQMITIESGKPCIDKFKLRTASGRPIPNVVIGGGYATNQNGELNLASYPHDSIKPVYTGQSGKEDISIYDLRLLNATLDNEVHLNAVQRIAADANFDGRVDHEDIETIYDYIFSDTPLVQNWVFVNLDSALSQMEGQFNVPWYSQKSVFEAGRSAYQYIGIRIGDVDLSILEPKEEVGDTLTLHYRDQYFQKGEIVEVPVSIMEELTLLSLYFTLNFDSDLLDFLNVEGIGTDDIDASDYNLISDSVLRFLWFEYTLNNIIEGVQDPAGLQPLLQFRYMAKEDGTVCDALQFDTSGANREIVYLNDQYNTPSATFITECTGKLTSSEDIHYPQAKFTVYPNPANTFFHIKSNELPGIICQYRLLHVLGGEVAAGSFTSNQPIPLENIPSGVYLLEIKAEGYAPAYKKVNILAR